MENKIPPTISSPIVDVLLAQTRTPSEHIDAATLKDAAEKAARNFCVQRNLEYSESLTDAALLGFFDRRLRFVGPKLKPIEEKLALAFITRDRWIKKASISAIAAISGIAVIVGINLLNEAKQREREQAPLVMLKKANFDMREMADAEAGRLGRLKASLPPDVPYAKILAEKAEATLSEIRTGIERASGVFENGASLEESVMEGGKANLSFFLLRRQISSAEELVRARNEFVATSRSPNFQSQLASPVIADLAAISGRNLKQPSDAAMGAIDSVRKLRAASTEFDLITPLEQRANYLNSLFGELGLDAQDQALVSGMLKELHDKKMAISLEGSKSALNELEESLRFAKTALAVLVVSREGTPSVVEKTDRDGKTKYRFAIVEAVDTEGNVVPVSVRSAETGITKRVQTFGVRITKEEMERIKSERTFGGAVRDRVIGIKPANKLTIVFNERTTQNPELITEW